MKLFKVRAEGPDPPGWRAGAREASEASQPGHPFHVITRVRGGAAAIVIAPDPKLNINEGTARQAGRCERSERGQPGWCGLLHWLL